MRKRKRQKERESRRYLWEREGMGREKKQEEKEGRPWMTFERSEIWSYASLGLYCIVGLAYNSL